METTERWQVVENVVAAIEKVRNVLPGLAVTQRAQLPRINAGRYSRDVDVLVELPIGGRTIKVAIEVKSKRRPLTLEEMGSIVDLRRDIAVDRFCVVSTSGFSDGAQKKAAENDIELSTLEEFEQSTFWAYPPETTLIKTGGRFLHSKFDFSEETLSLYGEKLQRAFDGTPFDELILSDDTGSTSVTNFLNALVQAEFGAHVAGLQHDDEFSFRVDLRERIGLKISAHGMEFPGPEFMTVTAKVSRVVERIRERRFRVGDLEVTTAEMNLFGATEQVSMVKVPRPDGTTQLVLSRGPTKPKKARKG